MIDLDQRSVKDLLLLHTAILDELRRREVSRSANGPVGDYGELLFAQAFGWNLQNNSSSGHDAVDAQGIRYQIKCRRVTIRTPSRVLSALRNLPDKPFDVLAGIIFDADYHIVRAALIPHAIILEKATFSKHVNAWRFYLRDAIWELPGVVDVTRELQAAASLV